ncbi:MAG: lipopeptide [Gammaproteobacteria bacterium]|nr:MAG: lipopeptide [Gammaproteobacteria bacterium]
MKSKILLCLFVVCCLTGCGQKGPLYKESKTSKNYSEQANQKR